MEHTWYRKHYDPSLVLLAKNVGKLPEDGVKAIDFKIREEFYDVPHAQNLHLSTSALPPK